MPTIGTWTEIANQKLLKISRKNPKSNYSFYRTIQIEKNTKAKMSTQPKISL